MLHFTSLSKKNNNISKIDIKQSRPLLIVSSSAQQRKLFRRKKSRENGRGAWFGLIPIKAHKS